MDEEEAEILGADTEDVVPIIMLARNLKSWDLAPAFYPGCLDPLATPLTVSRAAAAANQKAGPGRRAGSMDSHVSLIRDFML